MVMLRLTICRLSRFFCLPGNPVSRAQVRVVGINRDVLTTKAGEYWRVLPPGQYKLVAIDGNQRSREVDVNVDGRTSSIVNLVLE